MGNSSLVSDSVQGIFWEIVFFGFYDKCITVCIGPRSTSHTMMENWPFLLENKCLYVSIEYSNSLDRKREAERSHRAGYRANSLNPCCRKMPWKPREFHVHIPHDRRWAAVGTG